MTKFEQRFQALRNFVKENGHARVPTKYKVDGINLGGWISYLRTRYRTNRLDKETIQKLESVGMEWGPLTPGPQIADEERDQEIVKLREQNLSLAAIGEKYGLSRQRVHQILQRAQ
jgi:hypothetical protein